MPTTYPAFRQLCAIVREMITAHPMAAAADLKDLIKRRHVRLGYRYDYQQIPRAMDAVERAMRRAGLTIGPLTEPTTRPPAGPTGSAVETVPNAGRHSGRTSATSRRTSLPTHARTARRERIRAATDRHAAARRVI